MKQKGKLVWWFDVEFMVIRREHTKNVLVHSRDSRRNRVNTSLLLARNYYKTDDN